MRRRTSRSRVGRSGVEDGIGGRTSEVDGLGVSRRATEGGSRVDFGGRELELSSDFDDSGVRRSEKEESVSVRGIGGYRVEGTNCLVKSGS